MVELIGGVIERLQQGKRKGISTLFLKNVMKDGIDPADGHNQLYRFLLLGWAFGGGGRRQGRRCLWTRGLVHCRDARTIRARSILHVRRAGAAADEPADVGVADDRRHLSALNRICGRVGMRWNWNLVKIIMIKLFKDKFTVWERDEGGTGGESVFHKIVENRLEDGLIQSRQLVVVEQNTGAISVTCCDRANKKTNKINTKTKNKCNNIISHREENRRRLAKFYSMKDPRIWGERTGWGRPWESTWSYSTTDWRNSAEGNGSAKKWMTPCWCQRRSFSGKTRRTGP